MSVASILDDIAAAVMSEEKEDVGEAEVKATEDAAVAENEGEKEEKEAKDESQFINKEIEQCELQCTELERIIGEVQDEILQLLAKPGRTKKEDKDLVLKRAFLEEKLTLFDQKVRKVNLMVENKKKANYDKVYDEDSLPKIVVCGSVEDDRPRIIICDDRKVRTGGIRQVCNPLTGQDRTCPVETSKKKAPVCPCKPPPTPPPTYPAMPPAVMNVMPTWHEVDERLTREETLEILQRQVLRFQSELRNVVKENCLWDPRNKTKTNGDDCQL